MPERSQKRSISEMNCSMDAVSGNFPIASTGNFSMAANLTVGQNPYMSERGDDFIEGLKVVMAKRGIKPAPLSVAAGHSNSMIRDLIRNGSSPKLSSAMSIAKALGMSLEEIMLYARDPEAAERGSISLAGQVGAGAQIPLFDTFGKDGDGPQVECPPGLSPHGIVAVEIVGDSMEPLYSEGDVLFYARATHEGVPSEAIGRRCVCEDIDGMAWVKQVKPGDEPGTFNLIALNPYSATTRQNVRLKWAAPIKLHWPKELVRKV